MQDTSCMWHGDDILLHVTTHRAGTLETKAGVAPSATSRKSQWHRVGNKDGIGVAQVRSTKDLRAKIQATSVSSDRSLVAICHCFAMAAMCGDSASASARIMRSARGMK